MQASDAFDDVIALSRQSAPPLDVMDEESIRAAAEFVKGLDGEPGRIVDATDFLHDDRFRPEKTWSQLDPEHMARAFAVNTTGPALLMKHFLPLLPRNGKAVFATLSARVGSIGDNRLGGWYSYRASKAALNQFVHTVAIKLHRRSKDAICVALPPGTVNSKLSAPFGKLGLYVRSPDVAARELLALIARWMPMRTVGFSTTRERSCAGSVANPACIALMKGVSGRRLETVRPSALWSMGISR